MRTRKIVIAVLATALLISAMLIVGCIDQFDGISVKKAEDNYKIPAGKGVVRLNIRDIDTNARTILPDNISTGSRLEDMFFDVQFKKTSANGGGGTGAVNDVVYFPGYGGAAPGTKATWGEVQNPIVLDANWKYKYIITAYNVKTGTHIPIAGYTSPDDDLVVGSSVVTKNGINLTGFDNGTNNGIFSYDITIAYDDDYDYGNVNLLEINPFSPSGTPKTEIVLETSDTGSGSGTGTGTGVVSGSGASRIINFSNSALSLKSGYYTVTVTLSKGTKFATKQYTEALHIYPILTSPMTPLNIPALDKIKLDVTFSMAGSPTLTTTPSSPGTTAQLIDYGKRANAPSPAPTAATHSFDGWFAPGDGSPDYAWNFADRVFSDLPLYAQWTPNTGGKFTNITFTYNDEIDSLITTSSLGQIYEGALDGTNHVTIEFDTTGGTWSGIVWKINNKTVTGLVTGPVSGVYTLDINNKLDNGGGTPGNFEEFMIRGSTFQVSVYAVLTVNTIAKPYSKVIDIQVLAGNGP